jgi:hypothetical protein
LHVDIFRHPKTRNDLAVQRLRRFRPGRVVGFLSVVLQNLLFNAET